MSLFKFHNKGLQESIFELFERDETLNFK